MNPYVNNIKESAIRIIKLTAFGLVVMVGTAFLCSTHAKAESFSSQLPVTCMDLQQFDSEYKNKDFDIVSAQTVIIFVKGNAVPVKKIGTVSKDKKISGEWLLTDKNICIMYMTVNDSVSL